MGYKTKIQFIKRKYSRQFYVTIPAALADALELEKGEEVEWVVKNKKETILKRSEK